MIDPVDNRTVDMPLDSPVKPAKRRYGPAPIAPELKRNHCVSVRLNPAELAKLDSERGKIQRGAWLRDSWLGTLPPAPAPELNREAWIELSRAASNLNQLSKRLNEGGDVGLDEAKAELDAFRLALLGAEL